MPILSSKENRQLMQGLTPYEDVKESGFGDVYAASVGQVIDEELIISSALNREGWAERRQQVGELIDSGQVDGRKYLSGGRGGRQPTRSSENYDRIAKDYPEFGLKTDAELSESRKKLLADRRGYGKDVIERGSGIAQFLGAANGYMLDPVNIATIGIATAPVAARSLSVVGRALIVGRNEAALNLATELMIQPFVYGHKQDIDSPYSASDAIKNIAFAAGGGAVLGGLVGGIGGYLGKVGKAADVPVGNGVKRDEVIVDDLPDVAPSDNSNGASLDDAGVDYDALVREAKDSYEAAKEEARAINDKAQDAFDLGDDKLGESLLDEYKEANLRTAEADNNYSKALEARANRSTETVKGGIGGYLGKAIKSVDSLDVVTPEVDNAVQYLARMQESIEHGRSLRDTHDIAMDDYDALIRGEYESYQAAAANTVKEAQKAIDGVAKGEDTLGQFFAKSGGINRDLIASEGIDPAAFKDRGKVFGKPLYRKTGGKSADELAEALNEIGYKGGRLTANDVVDIITDIANGKDPLMNVDATAKIAFHQRIIDDFSKSPDDAYLRELYGETRRLDIESDVEYYTDLEAKKGESNKPSRTMQDYDEQPKTKPMPLKIRLEPFPTSVDSNIWHHGTNSKFQEFDLSKFGTNESKGDYVGEAFFFAQSKPQATKYAKQAGGNIVKSVYLDIKNPLIIKKGGVDKSFYDGVEIPEGSKYKTMGDNSKRFYHKMEYTEKQKADYAKSQGYDGMIDEDYGQAAVFDSAQIKIIEDEPTVTAREREILNTTGMADDFDADLAAYSRLENPAIIIDGEMVEAKGFMKELDDEISGIESVLVCVRG